MNNVYHSVYWVDPKETVLLHLRLYALLVWHANEIQTKLHLILAKGLIPLAKILAYIIYLGSSY